MSQLAEDMLRPQVDKKMHVSYTYAGTEGASGHRPPSSTRASEQSVKLALEPIARRSSTRSANHIDHNMVKKLQEKYQQYILACEDHRPHKMLAYCPLHFQQLMDKMYGDPQVFTKVKLTPVSAACSQEALLRGRQDPDEHHIPGLPRRSPTGQFVQNLQRPPHLHERQQKSRPSRFLHQCTSRPHPSSAHLAQVLQRVTARLQQLAGRHRHLRHQENPPNSQNVQWQVQEDKSRTIHDLHVRHLGHHAVRPQMQLLHLTTTSLQAKQRKPHGTSYVPSAVSHGTLCRRTSMVQRVQIDASVQPDLQQVHQTLCGRDGVLRSTDIARGAGQRRLPRLQHRSPTW